MPVKTITFEGREIAVYADGRMAISGYVLWGGQYQRAWIPIWRGTEGVRAMPRGMG